MSLTVLNVSYPLARVSPATAGGAEQVLLTLDRELVRDGHRSLVIAAAGSRCHGLLIPVEIPSGDLRGDAKVEARRRFRSALDYALENHAVDIIHMHGIDFCEYLPDCDLPIIVSLHLPLSWYRPAVLAQTRSNISLVSVSRAQARTAPRNVRIGRVIPNGVDIDHFHLAPSKNDYALFMGRVCQEKALHLAMDAAALARTKLLIAGTVFNYPEHREYFETMVRPRLGPNALFLGTIGGRRKADLLAGAKCLLIASQAQETSSLIAMEAMASGTPVIAWRSGALPEIVENGRTGFLVSSVEEMCDAIARVRALSTYECRLVAEHKFSSQQMVSGYFDLYHELTAGVATRELHAA